MNLDLLRQLAAKDLELPMGWVSGEGAPYLGDGSERVWFDQDPEDFTKELFWILLDRIKARGWRYSIELENGGWVGAEINLPNKERTVLARRYSKTGSECEALARAYLQALEQEGQG